MSLLFLFDEGKMASLLDAIRNQESKKKSIKESISLAGFNSFSGSDIKVMIAVPDGNGGNAIIKEMRNIQTLTYSIFREKGPVRSLGFVGEKGKARGTRTIAGSIVFTVFDRHPLLDLMRANFGDGAPPPGVAEGVNSLAYTLADQLPPFDIILHFANEYGFTAELVLLGVEIMSEGQVQSIQDIITENTVQYTARHMTIMRPGGYLAAFDQAAKDSADDYAYLTYGPDGEINGGRGFIGPRSPKKSFETIMNTTYKGALNQYIQKSHNPFR